MRNCPDRLSKTTYRWRLVTEKVEMRLFTLNWELGRGCQKCLEQWVADLVVVILNCNQNTPFVFFKTTFREVKNIHLTMVWC